MPRIAASVLAALVTSAGRAPAQLPAPPPASGTITLECIAVEGAAPQGPCQVALPATELLQQTYTLRLRAVNASHLPVAGALVRFRATAGAVMPDSSTTDAEGYVTTLWYRNRSPDPAGVTAEARTPAGSGMRFIQLVPPQQPAPTLAIHSGGMQWWFEKNQLRFPAVAEVKAADGSAITDPAACARHRVAFVRGPNAGSVSPDTVSPSVMDAEVGPDPERDGCFAIANWTLGDGPGRRHVRASLVNVPGSNATFQAVARGIPRLVAGPVWSYNRGYLGRRAGTTQVIRVERAFPDGTTLAFDSTITSRAAVDSVSGGWGAAPFIGLSTPVIPQWTFLSVTAGVDLSAPQDNWYAGISLTRLAAGVFAEGFPVDAHVVGHWGRSPSLRDSRACEGAGDCAVEDDVRFHGIGGVITFDATSLFAELIKKLTP